MQRSATSARVVGVRGHGAHAAGVEALVVVERALVVHGGDHRLDGLAVGKGQHRRPPGRSGTPRSPPGCRTSPKLLSSIMDPLTASCSLLSVLADQHALAQRQTVRLDDDGVRAPAFDIVQRLRRSRRTSHIWPWGCRISSSDPWQNTLLPSMMAAALVRAEGRDALLLPARPPCPAPAGRPGRPRQSQCLLPCAKSDHGVHVRGLDGHAVGVMARCRRCRARHRSFDCGGFSQQLFG